MVALALAVAVGLGLYADFGRLGDELGRFRWELFPAAAALTALNYLLRFWRWQRYLARLEIRVPAGRSLSIFVAGLAVITTIASSLVPALRVARQDVSGALKDEGRSSTGTGGGAALF